MSKLTTMGLIALAALLLAVPAGVVLGEQKLAEQGDIPEVTPYPGGPPPPHPVGAPDTVVRDIPEGIPLVNLVVVPSSVPPPYQAYHTGPVPWCIAPHLLANLTESGAREVIITGWDGRWVSIREYTYRDGEVVYTVLYTFESRDLPWDIPVLSVGNTGNIYQITFP